MPPVPQRPIDRRLVAPAIGAWSATAGCTLLAPLAAIVVAALMAVVGLIAVRRSTVASALVAGLALGALLGAASAGWHVHALQSGPLPALAAEHSQVEVKARLVRDPVRVTTATGTTLTLADATVTSLLKAGWHRTKSPVLILSYGAGWLGLLPGQRVELSGRVAPPRAGDDVTAVINARGSPTLLGVPPWWQRLAGRVRLGLRRATNGLPADERGLLPGLVDGDVSAVPTSMHDDLRVTGLTHLEAVSGENTAVVLAVTMAVAAAIGLRRRLRVAVAATALLAFVVLARPSPSVLRAAVMGAVMLAAMASGRRVSPLPMLSIAVLTLVVIDPFLARSIGFVLSVCATAALLTVAPAWTERLAGHLPRSLAAMIAIPAAAQLACTPVLIAAFGQLTPYAIPANLLAAPVVAPATVLGVVVAVTAPVAFPVAVALAWVAAVPTAAIALVARTFAGLPGAGLAWPGGWLPAAAGFAAVATLAIVIRHRRSRRPPAAVTF
jgi:competence protein ComEC